jgi:hypothetical protein
LTDFSDLDALSLPSRVELFCATLCHHRGSIGAIDSKIAIVCSLALKPKAEFGKNSL